MSNDPVNSVGSVNTTNSQLKAQQSEAAQNAENLMAEQVATEEDLASACDYESFNPLAIHKRFETLEKKASKNPKDEPKAHEETPTPIVEGTQEALTEFDNSNPEISQELLEKLKSSLTDDDSVDEILNKLKNYYSDEYLADEALGILIKVTNPKSKLFSKLQQARTRHQQSFQRQITAGKNIVDATKDFSEQGLGSASELRDLYKDVTGEPRDPTQLFEELADKYDYEKMTDVIKFLLSAIGSDLRSKGPSITRPELQTLFNETRTMQAILGIYRFFQSRMNLIGKEFERNDLNLPSRISFDVLAKQFVIMISERYPSIDKIFKLGILLGIGDDLTAQIIIYTQFRDGLRQVSPRLFKSEKHRQDLLLTLLDTLSEIEDELDEEEEEDEDEEEEENKK